MWHGTLYNIEVEPHQARLEGDQNSFIMMNIEYKTLQPSVLASVRGTQYGTLGYFDIDEILTLTSWLTDMFFYNTGVL